MIFIFMLRNKKSIDCYSSDHAVYRVVNKKCLTGVEHKITNR